MFKACGAPLDRVELLAFAGDSIGTAAAAEQQMGLLEQVPGVAGAVLGVSFRCSRPRFWSLCWPLAPATR